MEGLLSNISVFMKCPLSKDLAGFSRVKEKNILLEKNHLLYGARQPLKSFSDFISKNYSSTIIRLFKVSRNRFTFDERK